MGIWTDEEKELLKQNYGKIPLKELQKLIPNRAVTSIKKKANNLGILYSQEARNVLYRKYQLDENYFSKPNVENCYWAGFIAADGYVGGRNFSELALQISKKDVELLDKFKVDLQSEAPIRIKKDNEYVRFLITSSKICRDLKNNFNITTKKSMTLQPPDISDINQALAYLKGNVDGDGCIYFVPENLVSLQFLGTESLMIWFKNIIDMVFEGRSKSTIQKKKNIYSYTINGKISWCFAKLLEEVILPNHGLRRKWAKFHHARVLAGSDELYDIVKTRLSDSSGGSSSCVL